MARRTVTVTITAEGRDKGKQFFLTELPAEAAEDWGLRALNAISKTMGIPSDEFLNSGLSGIAALGASAFMRAEWGVVKPLLDEMRQCIRIIPDPAKPEIMRANLVADDIEEVATWLKLRQEVLELHLGFFNAAVDWLWTMVRSRLQQPQTDGNTSGTPT